MEVSCDASCKASPSAAVDDTPSGHSGRLPQKGWGRVCGDARARCSSAAGGGIPNPLDEGAPDGGGPLEL